MSQKKYAVLKWALSGTLLSILWFDARKDAYDFAASKNEKREMLGPRYTVKEMMRGPHA